MSDCNIAPYQSIEAGCYPNDNLVITTNARGQIVAISSDGEVTEPQQPIAPYTGVQAGIYTEISEICVNAQGYITHIEGTFVGPLTGCSITPYTGTPGEYGNIAQLEVNSKGQIHAVEVGPG